MLSVPFQARVDRHQAVDAVHFQAVAELGRHLEAEPPPQRRRQVDGVVLRVRQRPMWAYVLLPTTSATWRARATDADAARTSASVRRSPEFIPRYRYAQLVQPRQASVLQGRCITRAVASWPL